MESPLSNSRMHWDHEPGRTSVSRGFVCPIPKGLRPPAQGCRASEATLGTLANDPINRNAVVPAPFLPPNPVHPVNPGKIPFPPPQCYVQELVIFGKILFVPIVLFLFAFLSAPPREPCPRGSWRRPIKILSSVHPNARVPIYIG